MFAQIKVPGVCQFHHWGICKAHILINSRCYISLKENCCLSLNFYFSFLLIFYKYYIIFFYKNQIFAFCWHPRWGSNPDLRLQRARDLESRVLTTTPRGSILQDLFFSVQRVYLFTTPRWTGR